MPSVFWNAVIRTLPEIPVPYLYKSCYELRNSCLCGVLRIVIRPYISLNSGSTLFQFVMRRIGRTILPREVGTPFGSKAPLFPLDDMVVIARNRSSAANEIVSFPWYLILKNSTELLSNSCIYASRNSHSELEKCRQQWRRQALVFAARPK